MRCPKCKSKKQFKYGTMMSGGKRVQRYQCQSCGHQFPNKKEVING
jgi:transposase-like protein